MVKRFTLSEVVEKIGGRLISVLNYAGNVLAVSQFQCTAAACGNVWSTSASNVIRGSGCPKCAHGDIPLKKVQQKLDGRGVSVESYAGSAVNKNSTFKCDKAGHKWTASAASVLRGSGCPKCARLAPVTIEEARAKLTGRPVEIIDFGLKVKDRSVFKCLDAACGHTWKTTANSVVNAGSGCPICVIHAKNTDIEEVLYRLKGRNIALVSYGGSVTSKSEFRCGNQACGNVWKAHTGSVVSTGTGCPVCAKSGFDATKPAEFYLYKISTDRNTYIGFGITNSPAVRHRSHRKAFRNCQATGDLIFSRNMQGVTAREVESDLKKHLCISDTGIPGFKTEAVLYDNSVLEEIVGRLLAAPKQEGVARGF